MRTNLDRSIKWKDGSTWSADEPVIITINRERPMQAILTNREGIEKKVRSQYLHLWFNDFQAISMSELEEAVFDCVCPSLTGELVEPDGWDSKGMPSILLACGIC